MIGEITFYSRFVEDIIAKKKTITIRDESEAHFKPGEFLRVSRYEDGTPFCFIKIVSVTAVSLS